MKLAVIGSRGFNDFELLSLFLDSYLNCALDKNDTLVIVSGGAKGADSLAEKYSKDHGLETVIFLPDYNRYHSKVAPIIRNTQIIEAADEVIAFWDGESRGTLDSMNKARRLNKTVLEVRYKELK